MVPIDHSLTPTTLEGGSISILDDKWLHFANLLVMNLIGDVQGIYVWINTWSGINLYHTHT